MNKEKLWGDMSKQEKLDILEALLDGERVEAYKTVCINDKYVQQWEKTWMGFFWDDIPLRIVK